MQEEISKTIYKYDPGVLRPLGVPPDEYQNEAAQIVASYNSGMLASSEGVEELLIKQLGGVFHDLKNIDRDLVRKLAEEVWQQLTR